MKRQLAATDIIGKKIVSVYEKAIEKTERFQNRLIFVRLDNDVLFDIADIRYPKKDTALVLRSCDYERSFVPALSIKKNPDLDSPIKAIISNESFAIEAAILLENEFVLTIGIGEFDMGHDFHRYSKTEKRDYLFTVEIANL